MKVACIQTLASSDKAQNNAASLAFIDQAAAQGARLVVLPELSDYYGPPHGHLAAAEPIPGPTSGLFSQKAREHGIWIVAGSLHERAANGDRYRNTSLVIAPGGAIAARYSKMHLFDVTMPGQFDFRESDMTEPGDAAATALVDDIRIGLSICYDLRFPELYRAMASHGAKALCVPAAFQLYTGRDHWEILLRARAIENQCFVLAAGTIGGTPPTAGRSMIVDPWGLIIAQASDQPGIVTADLDFPYLEAVRARLPALKHRRPELNLPAPADAGA